MVRLLTVTWRRVFTFVLVAGIAVQASPQALVNFVDDDLEAAVRAAIGRPQGPIYSHYLRNGALTELNAAASDISNLTGLQYAVELESLDLSNNAISDLIPLADLVSLRVLNLEGNRIRNVQSLARLTNLEDLDLSNNLVASLESLLPNTGLGAGDRLDFRANPLNQRTLCGVLDTFVARGATVLADGECTGTGNDPGNVDQRPDLFGYLRALDPDTHEQIPVTCGAVEVYAGRQLVAVAVTNSRGYFFVEGLTVGGIYDLVLHAQGYEELAMDDVVLQRQGQEVVSGVFQALSDPVISGTILLTVFDPQAPRPPIAGALVRVFQFNVEVARTITCASGYFEFDDSEIPFPGTARLEFSAEDFVPEPLNVILPALDLQIGLEKLVFPSTILGVVVDGLTGDPIEGAEVLVQPTLGLVTYPRTTGPDGSYAVENVEDGEYSVHALADGFDDATEFGFVEQDILQIDLELPRKGTSPGVGCAGGSGRTIRLADLLIILVVLAGLSGWRLRCREY